MATSLLPALALGPVSLLGQALMKFQRATSVPSWLYMMIEPFLRASSILPCSTILRHCHISIASVMPRLSVILFHFIRPGTFLMMNSPFGPLALYSTTSFSLPRPEHSRKAPTTCPWNSTPNHAETTGFADDIVLLLQRQASRFAMVCQGLRADKAAWTLLLRFTCLCGATGPLAQAEDDELGGLHWRETDINELLAAVAHVGRTQLLIAFDEEGLLRRPAKEHAV